jgi:hypothetical protein
MVGIIGNRIVNSDFVQASLALCLNCVLVNALQGTRLLPGSEEETIFCYLVPFALCFMKV